MGSKIASGVKWVSQKVCSFFNRVGDLFKKLVNKVADWFDNILGESTSSSANFVNKYSKDIDKADNPTNTAKAAALGKQIDKLEEERKKLLAGCSKKDRGILDKLNKLSKGENMISNDIDQNKNDDPYVTNEEADYFLNRKWRDENSKAEDDETDNKNKKKSNGNYP